MTRDRYVDGCSGCMPKMVDVRSGEILPDEHPVMVALLTEWRSTTLPERRAFHRVMCLHSRDPADLQSVAEIHRRWGVAVSRVTMH